jgi:CheY-like chemotaxis protein
MAVLVFRNGLLSRKPSKLSHGRCLNLTAVERVNSALQLCQRWPPNTLFQSSVCSRGLSDHCEGHPIVGGDLLVVEGAAVRLSRSFMTTRILVVHPDAELRAVLVQTLEAMRFKVTTAQSGREALAALVTDPIMRAPIHGVLLNLELHGLDGTTVLREIKDRHPAIRVLAMTKGQDPDRVTQALADGAAGVLTQPMNMDLFKRTCQTVFSFRGHDH